MRNLKKILALVLALMMTVSLMVVASAASYDDYSDKDEIDPKYAEAVEVLSGIGIFIGDEDGFRPTDDLSRAEVATLLYRVLSGDPADAEVDDFASYQVFDDVLPGAWPAGHVYYAYAAGWIKGNGDGTYAPDNGVLGCELAAMLVRALGRDKNGDELNGDGNEWAYKAVNLATELGITKGLGGVYLLTDTLTREQAAQMIFNALQVKMFTQVIGDYYQINRTLIGLDSKAGSDEWGRPTKVWFTEDVPSGVATIEEEPVKTYYEAVTECDVATDVGIDSTKTYDTYTNGYLRAKGATIVATDTKNTIGAQGTRTEVYKDRIVFIETYLAKVESVKDATYDHAGHLDDPSQITLSVYENGNNGTPVTMTNKGTNYDYTKGQYVLVNAFDKANGTIDKNEDVVILQVAESFVGAQSKLWYNESKHTINSEDYIDAVNFELDEAGNDQTENHTWYLDQYGNLIGATDINSTNYAVLKDIIWVVGKPGHAEATLVDMNGNEYTATVNTMDGDATAPFNWDADDYTTKYTDTATNTGFSSTDGGKANISDEGSHNKVYEGHAMYRVDTRMDGTVNLQGKTIVSYYAKASVHNDASLIAKENNQGRVVGVSDSTLFLVKGANNSYTTYQGTSEIPSYVDSTVEVFYVDLNGDDIAEYVYIKNGTVASTDGKHTVFVLDDDYTKVPNSNDYVVENALLDGEPASITVADEDIAKKLTSNVKKLFVVDFNNGKVDDLSNVDLVTVDPVKLDDGTTARYVGSDVTVDGKTMIDSYAGVVYRVNNAETYGENVALTTDALEGEGVWLIYTTATTRNTASQVYVGEALGETAGMDADVLYVDGDDSIIATFNYFSVNGQKWEPKLLEGTTVKLVVNAVNAATITNWYSHDNSYTYTMDVTHNKQFEVTSESGATVNTYYVALTPEAVAAPELETFCGYQVYDYNGTNGGETATNPYRTVYFTEGDKIAYGSLTANVEGGIIKGYKTWDEAAGSWIDVTGDLTVSPTADETWVQVTVTGYDGNTYTFVVNTIYQP